MTEEHKQKIRQTHLRLWHGENWTEEDQKEFEKARNDRHANNWRKKHRDTYNACMKRAQDKWRKEKPYYYGWKQHLRFHPESDLTYEQYIEYRKQKEAKKEKE